VTLGGRNLSWSEIAWMAGVVFVSNLIGFFAATAIQITPVKENLREVKARVEFVNTKLSDRSAQMETRLTLAEARALVNSTNADAMKDTLKDVKDDVAWIRKRMMTEGDR
jgi:enamine deaminase RidA (YjgF/YER057c/UK114 family)